MSPAGKMISRSSWGEISKVHFHNSFVVVKLMHGRSLAPLKCYIMQGDHPLPERVIEKFAKTGGELCQDVFLLGEHFNLFGHPCCPDTSVGKSGIITTAHGLRIACLGGIYDSNIYSEAE